LESVVTDYYSFLSRAIADTDSNTPEARAKIYDRARALVTEQIRINRDQWTVSRAGTEQTRLDAAIDRIEVESSQRGEGIANKRLHPQSLSQLADANHVPAGQTSRPLRRVRTSVFVSLLGVIAAICVGVLAYIFRPELPTKATAPELHAGAKVVSNQAVIRTGNTGIDTEEIPPGVDGGSTEAGLPYFFRRQPIFYRTIYSVGMLVVDRSQRFLYLVQPQSSALRYGIGVGGECPSHAGLQRISLMAEWPEWTPSAELLKRRNYPPRIAGGPGNPLGARALYFENSTIGIHGTNAPKTVGQAVSLGCYRMVNDSIVDLYKRVTLGAGVVVLN
jgi:lipoprotein-anchoring transpeptidase ErfK/SrfK